MRPDVDLAIIGSGCGGSILAMIAQRLGYRVALIERGRHPRFAIGESASPLLGILLEQLADRYDLPRLRPLSAFGTWQRTYPEIGCGLKRGFTYYSHTAGERCSASRDRTRQLLVAASPNDELSDTHWLRTDVDHWLVREAVALGVDYQDGVTVDAIDWDAGGGPVLNGTRGGAACRLRAHFVVDASGPRGALGRAVGVADRGFDGYPGTQALFSHFTGVERCAAMPDFAGADGDAPPYPPDDAALHHVFDGGWMWVLRFGNGVTSAGAAVTDALAAELRLADGEPAWHRLLARFPSVQAQFAGATAIRDFTWMPRMAARASIAAGGSWAMLPSAAAFVDPLFSTGIPLTLLGTERLARLLARDRPSAGSPLIDAASLADYSAATLAEADHTARYVGGCYAAFPQFADFTDYAMFYFAAASFSEMARRLDAPRRPRRFLCADRDDFAGATRTLSPAHGIADRARYAAQVRLAIEPLNVAGLCDPAKRNWYGVDLDDAVRGAEKLGLAADAVQAANARMLAATTCAPAAPSCSPAPGSSCLPPPASYSGRAE